MSDIVERLEQFISDFNGHDGFADPADLAAAAKAEILRLRSEWQAIREECAKVADELAKDSCEAAIDDARAQKFSAANHWNAHAAGCVDVAAAIRSLPPHQTEE